mgnify:CR=1 FL=1
MELQTNFDNNPRRQQELRGRGIADGIYRNKWGDVDITRSDGWEDAALDIEFAIDVTVTMPNGMVLNGQEKFLSHKYSAYSSLTVEYMQNASTDEQGDWFKLAPQFYTCAYFDESGNDFEKYVIVDWAQVVLNSNKGLINWLTNHG